jgi:hypothetical protein
MIEERNPTNQHWSYRLVIQSTAKSEQLHLGRGVERLYSLDGLNITGFVSVSSPQDHQRSDLRQSYPARGKIHEQPQILEDEASSPKCHEVANLAPALLVLSSKE